MRRVAPDGLCGVVFISCNITCCLAQKRAVWCLKIAPVTLAPFVEWPELIREEVFMVAQFRYKHLIGKLFILHSDSHFVEILVDDIAEIVKTFLQIESTSRNLDNLFEMVLVFWV